MNEQRSIFLPIVLTVVVSAIVFGGLGYYLAMGKYSAETNKTSNYTSTTPTTLTTLTPTAASVNDTSYWKTFTNQEVGFTLKYPNNWNDLKFEKIVASNKEAAAGTHKGVLYHTDGQGTADMQKNIILSLHSQDYFFYASSGLLNKKRIDVNWNKEQFNKEMGYDAFFVKKLSDQSLLVASYGNVECSPALALGILTPVTDKYPNLEVYIRHDFDSDPLVKDYLNSKNGDGCDLHDQYQKIADKINSGIYPEGLSAKITTAQLIADSVKIGN